MFDQKVKNIIQEYDSNKQHSATIIKGDYE